MKKLLKIVIIGIIAFVVLGSVASGIWALVNKERPDKYKSSSVSFKYYNTANKLKKEKLKYKYSRDHNSYYSLNEDFAGLPVRDSGDWEFYGYSDTENASHNTVYVNSAGVPVATANKLDVSKAEGKKIYANAYTNLSIPDWRTLEDKTLYPTWRRPYLQFFYLDSKNEIVTDGAYLYKTKGKKGSEREQKEALSSKYLPIPNNDSGIPMIFKGYFDAETGGTLCADKNGLVIAEESYLEGRTLYPQFERVNFVLQLNTQCYFESGDKVEAMNTSVTKKFDIFYGETLEFEPGVPNLTEGYVFLGWYLADIKYSSRDIDAVFTMVADDKGKFIENMSVFNDNYKRYIVDEKGQSFSNQEFYKNEYYVNVYPLVGIRTYDVSLKYNNGDDEIFKVLKIRHDISVTPELIRNSLESLPAQQYYTFNYWALDPIGENPLQSETLTGDLTLYAQWTPVDITFEYERNGGTFASGEGASVSIKYGEAVTGISFNISKNNYSFLGWYSSLENGVKYSDQTGLLSNKRVLNEDNYVIVNNKVKLYAVYEPQTVAVEFHSNYPDISPLDAEEFTRQIVVVEALPQPEGWGDAYLEFSHYKDQSGKVVNKVEEESVLYAVWKAKIKFITGTQTSINDIVLDADAALGLPAVQRDGYTFDGWYYDSIFNTKCTLTKMPAYGFTLYANWVPKTYSIVFDCDGICELDPISGNYQSEILTPPNPKCAHYKFGGWYKDKEYTESYIFSFMPLNGDTVYVKWIPIMVDIAFETNGGPSLEDCSVLEGSVIEEPVIAKRGYLFEGWYTDAEFNNLFDFDSEILISLTLYANWERDSFELSFNVDGDTDIYPSAIYLFQESLTDAAPETSPEKADFEFIGWYELGSETPYAFEKMTYHDLVLFARWQPVYVSLYVDYNGGNGAQNRYDVARGQAPAEPKSPYLAGYSFKGWYTTEELIEPFDFNAAILENKTIYASWALNNEGIPIANYGDIQANLNNADDTFYLKNDIDCGGVVLSEPLINTFFGVLEGNHYKIFNLSFNAEKGIALIRQNSGTIRNLTLEISDSEVNYPDDNITYNVSALVTLNEGNILNCNTSGKINITAQANIKVGGIVSRNLSAGSIVGCASALEIIISSSKNGTKYIGGIAGENEGNITEQHYTGKISFTSEHYNGDRVYIGGIAGYSYASGEISHNTLSGGDITFRGKSMASMAFDGYLGGIAGYSASPISYCSIVDAKIDTAFDLAGSGGGSINIYIGGIVAFSTANISRCSAAGDISFANTSGFTGINLYAAGLVGTAFVQQGGGLLKISHSYTNINITSNNANTSYAGGIAGSASENTQIQNCYSEGSIELRGFLGGLVAVSKGEIKNSYSISSLKATGEDSVVGGLAASLSGSITNSFFDGSFSYSQGNIGLISGQTTSNSVISDTYYNIDLLEGDYDVSNGITEDNEAIKSSYFIFYLLGWDSSVWSLGTTNHPFLLEEKQL